MKVKLECLTKRNYPLKDICNLQRIGKNVELTGYLKFINGKSEKKDEPDEFTWYAKGGEHETSDNGYEASAYDE